LVQLGQVDKVTDIANTVGLVKYLDTSIDLMGDEYALDMDTRIRNILVHQSTGFKKRYAQGLANFAALAAASLANGCLLPRDCLDAMTQLKLKRAPMINGHYVAIVPPQGTRDILNNSEWREVVRNNYADKIFQGEVGDLFGLRLLEGTNPFREDETEGTEATTFDSGDDNTTGFIYSTVITGKGGYGTVDLKKLGGVAKKPQIIIVDKPDSGNPLNQFTLVGWKAYWVGVMLNSNWGVTLRHKTQYVG
jgi:N4-gp56 family major capsid protein